MAIIEIKSSGSFRNTDRWFNKMSRPDVWVTLNSYGRQGVAALAAATPLDSGNTANSWTYEVEITRTRTTLTWLNTNTVNGVNIAIILQYGHGTGTGGYVAGRDYINPAIKPIFDDIANGVWKEVTS